MKKDKILDIAIQAALDAGERIMQLYNTGINPEYKVDHSPLTQADKDAHNIIAKHLAVTGIPVLSEEGKTIPYSGRQNWQQLWIVDPLDGTKEFLKQNGEFTVNIALVKDSTPVLGVVYWPAEKRLYFASETIQASYTKTFSDGQNQNYASNATKLPVSQNRQNFLVVASRSHRNAETENFIQQLMENHPDCETIAIGSSLKMCLIAQGAADVYPRFAPTYEWDTAAAHAIVKYAGGTIVDAKLGTALQYNKRDLLNPWFIAHPK
jgi:3'(2'), 5'-bisphosphate nucleotidase